MTKKKSRTLKDMPIAHNSRSLPYQSPTPTPTPHKERKNKKIKTYLKGRTLFKREKGEYILC